MVVLLPVRIAHIVHVLLSAVRSGSPTGPTPLSGRIIVPLPLQVQEPTPSPPPIGALPTPSLAQHAQGQSLERTAPVPLITGQPRRPPDRPTRSDPSRQTPSRRPSPDRASTHPPAKARHPHTRSVRGRKTRSPRGHLVRGSTTSPIPATDPHIPCLEGEPAELDATVGPNDCLVSTLNAACTVIMSRSGSTSIGCDVCQEPCATLPQHAHHECLPLTVCTRPYTMACTGPRTGSRRRSCWKRT